MSAADANPFRRRVKRLYEFHKPDKLDTLTDAFFEKMEKKGKKGEEKMLKTLVEKYGPEPPADWQPISGSSPGKSDHSTPLAQEPDMVFRKRVLRFYQHYNPAKVDTLTEAVFRNFEKDGEKGQDKVIRSLVEKYGPEPSHHPENSSAPSDASGTQGSASGLQKAFRVRVMRLYQYYSPEKVDSLTPEFFQKLEKNGQKGEEKVLRSLVEKYGPEPAEDWQPATTHHDEHDTSDNKNNEVTSRHVNANAVVKELPSQNVSRAASQQSSNATRPVFCGSAGIGVQESNIDPNKHLNSDSFRYNDQKHSAINKFHENHKRLLEAASLSRPKNREPKVMETTSSTKQGFQASYEDMNNDFFNPINIISKTTAVDSANAFLPGRSHINERNENTNANATSEVRQINSKENEYTATVGSEKSPSPFNTPMIHQPSLAFKQPIRQQSLDQDMLVQVLARALAQQQQQQSTPPTRGSHFSMNGRGMVSVGAGYGESMPTLPGFISDSLRRNSDHELVPAGDPFVGESGYPGSADSYQQGSQQSPRHIAGMLDTKDQDNFVFNIITKARVQRSLFDTKTGGNQLSRRDGYDAVCEHPKNKAHKDIIKEKERIIKIEGMLEKLAQDNLYKPLNYSNFLASTATQHYNVRHTDREDARAEANRNINQNQSHSTPSRGEGRNVIDVLDTIDDILEQKNMSRSRDRPFSVNNTMPSQHVELRGYDDKLPLAEQRHQPHKNEGINPFDEIDKQRLQQQQLNLFDDLYSLHDSTMYQIPNNSGRIFAQPKKRVIDL